MAILCFDDASLAFIRDAIQCAIVRLFLRRILAFTINSAIGASSHRKDKNRSVYLAKMTSVVTSVAYNSIYATGVAAI
jgi:hypothetical protein